MEVPGGSTAVLAMMHTASIAPAMLPDFGRVWAYVTLAVTGIITEEATPLVGGLAAHDGRLNLLSVAWWIAVGTWVADILLYYVGRWRGHWVRKRWLQRTAELARRDAELLRCVVNDRFAFLARRATTGCGDGNSAACGGDECRGADEDRLLSGEFHEPKGTSQP